MADLAYATGWISDPQRVTESIQERESRGQLVMGAAFAANKPQLRGTWARMKASGYKGVFLRDREKKLLGGHYRRPYFQRAGTCVSRGMARGVQVSLDVSIVDNVSLLKPIEISFAPIYTLARHEIGKDRCGYGDGAILADAAKAVHDDGVATTDLFAGKTEVEVEKLAVHYATPGVGTPADWIKACEGHVAATFFIDSLDLLFDCIAAGYAVPYASGRITGPVNSKGMSSVGDVGGHCRMFSAVFIDENGEDQLESTESWSAYPAADPSDVYSMCPVDEIPVVKLHYAGGIKPLAPGCVGVPAKQWWSLIQSGGEAWGVGPAKFESNSMAETQSNEES